MCGWLLHWIGVCEYIFVLYSLLAIYIVFYLSYQWVNILMFKFVSRKSTITTHSSIVELYWIVLHCLTFTYLEMHMMIPSFNLTFRNINFVLFVMECKVLKYSIQGHCYPMAVGSPCALANWFDLSSPQHHGKLQWHATYMEKFASYKLRSRFPFNIMGGFSAWNTHRFQWGIHTVPKSTWISTMWTSPNAYV